MKKTDFMHQVMVLVPEAWLNEVTESLKLLVNRPLGNGEPTLGEWITEKQAMILLRKKDTWFWNKRKSGELFFKKVGGTVYYNMSDLIGMIERGKR